jgi:hypothetical protein
MMITIIVADVDGDVDVDDIVHGGMLAVVRFLGDSRVIPRARAGDTVLSAGATTIFELDNKEAGGVHACHVALPIIHH